MITSRHVLTAAHCLYPNLHSVRLGEYDTSTLSDGDNEDIEVIKIDKYPGYDEKDKTGDIAILTLAKDVEFTGNSILIKCLRFSEKIIRRAHFKQNVV